MESAGNRFRATLWSAMHAFTRALVYALEIGGPNQPSNLPAYLRPAACEEHYLASDGQRGRRYHF